MILPWWQFEKFGIVLVVEVHRRDDVDGDPAQDANAKFSITLKSKFTIVWNKLGRLHYNLIKKSDYFVPAVGEVLPTVEDTMLCRRTDKSSRIEIFRRSFWSCPC